jgi:hypothetical protein
MVSESPGIKVKVAEHAGVLALKTNGRTHASGLNVGMKLLSVLGTLLEGNSAMGD